MDLSNAAESYGTPPMPHTTAALASESPEDRTKQSTTGSESSGFKSFWRKPHKTNAEQNFTFVEQSPVMGRRGARDRIARLFRGGSQASSNKETSEQSRQSAGDPSSGRRRQQVYSAQKLHRERKANYVGALEAEVARLQALDSQVNTEKNRLTHQNGAIKAFLASHSLETQLETASIAPPLSSSSISPLDAAIIDIRFDSEMENNERTFLDLPHPYPPTLLKALSLAQLPDEPSEADSWAALDFILALEWPCRNHISHPAINPSVKASEALDVGNFAGHALTTTAAVYQSAQPPHSGNKLLPPGSAEESLPARSQVKWQLPHSEIDKLVQLSNNLPIGDFELTPAQAYAAVKQHIPHPGLIRPVLDALKEPLGPIVGCYGFGATMSTNLFWQHFEEVCQRFNVQLVS